MYDERLSGVGCWSFVRSWRPDNLLFIRHFAPLSAQVSLDLQQESSSPSCWQRQKKSALQTIFLLRLLCSSLLASQISRATERLRETLRSREGDMPHNHVLLLLFPSVPKTYSNTWGNSFLQISFLADTFFFVHFETPLEIETTFHLCLPRHQLILTRSTLARHFNILLTLSSRFETRLSRCD